MNYREFNFRQNLIVFRVTDISGVVNHECDCLIMSMSGYLTEIEIKRSYSDFLNDFKKEHTHNDARIKEFFYCVHENFYEKVINYLVTNHIVPSGIYVYDDDCNLNLEIGHNRIVDFIRDDWNGDNHIMRNPSARKLFLEERFQLARLGAMRYRNMTEKVIKMSKH